MKFTGPSWTRNLLVLLLVTGSLACTSPSYVLELESSSDTFYQLDDQIPEDSAMVALVAVYAADLQSRMNTVIARSETPHHPGPARRHPQQSLCRYPPLGSRS